MTAPLREALRALQHEVSRLKDENRELREENQTLQQVLDALRALQDVSASVTSSTNVMGLLDRILQAALTSIQATAGSLLLLDDNEELVFTVVHGEIREELTNYRLPPGTGVAGWVAQHLEPVIIGEAHLDPRFSPLVDDMFHFETRTMICVPIASPRKVYGVISALNKVDGREFTTLDLSLLAVVAQLAATAMERAEAATPAGT
jgi:sigma-B regulation protein RsbU (phosphoserine phosphatase)